eukprot:1157217-Pelagomonas_calceolata.AAC.11
MAHCFIGKAIKAHSPTAACKQRSHLPARHGIMARAMGTYTLLFPTHTPKHILASPPVKNGTSLKVSEERCTA